MSALFIAPIQKWSATLCSEKLALWILKGVLLFVRLELRVGNRKRAGEEELGGTWRRAKDEDIHARLDVPRSEATWRWEPGVNTFIWSAQLLRVCAAKLIVSSNVGPESTWLRNFLFQKKFVGLLASKNFSGSMIQAVLNLLNKVIGDFVNVRPLRYKRRTSPLVCFIEPSLPRMIWLSEITTGR